MGPIYCTETSAEKCHPTLRNIPEERISRIQRGRSLKSPIDNIHVSAVIGEYNENGETLAFVGYYVGYVCSWLQTIR